MRKVCAFATGLLIAASAISHAAEIKVTAGTGIKTVLEILIVEFERSTGHTVVATYGTGDEVKKRVATDNPDIVVATRVAFDDLVRQGKIRSDSVVNVARTLVGIAVRAGTPKPDIGSVDEVKRTLRQAKGIVYADPASGSSSANHFVRVLDRLGLTEEMKPKTHFRRRAAMAELVVDGVAEIAISQISELLPLAGIEIVGPLPADLQNLSEFTIAAGVVVGATQPEAGKALIQMLLAPSAAPLIKAKGLEPG
jgi:molybdate transport system substrate-binding protein